MTEFFLFKCRHGDEEILTPKTREAWDFLVERMEQDNGVTFDQARAEGFEIEGSYEEGWFYMDDGGEIKTIRLTNVMTGMYIES